MIRLKKSRHFRYVFFCWPNPFRRILCDVFVRTPVYIPHSLCVREFFGLNLTIRPAHSCPYSSRACVVSTTMRNGYTAFRKRYETFKSLTTPFVLYRTTREHTIDRYKRPKRPCHRRGVATTRTRINGDRALAKNANVFKDIKYFDSLLFVMSTSVRTPMYFRHTFLILNGRKNVF